MKFDPTNWEEIADGEEFESSSGSLHVRSSEDCAVYVESEGVEALAGTGREVRVEAKAPFRFYVNGGGRHFLKKVFKASFQPTGETYTNADRMPLESGTMAEITKALRNFKLEQHAMRKIMAQERKELEAARRKSQPQPAPAPDPVEEVEDPATDTKDDDKSAE